MACNKVELNTVWNMLEFKINFDYTINVQVHGEYMNVPIVILHTQIIHQ